MMINGVISVIIAYLLGSIPAAYVITRLATGKDIRQLGGGNVGARNVFQKVGKGAGVAVAIFDIGKGAAAVAIAYWLSGSPSMQLIGVPQMFVLAAGLAVVAGHMWSIFLKFTGGNGLATSLGVLSILLTRELLIVLAITLIFVVLTHNYVLSVNMSFLLIPISAWLLGESGLFIVFTILLILIMALHFLPTARAAFADAGSRENFFAELLRRDKAEKKVR
ncbi:glycerol-3-phosphate acyltransferase [Chloroflexota bacterium]